jgi:hypothetical protein
MPLRRRARVSLVRSYPPGPNRQANEEAPSWLWSSVVELVASHEAAYLEHCRRYAVDPRDGVNRPPRVKVRTWHPWSLKGVWLRSRSWRLTISSTSTQTSGLARITPPKEPIKNASTPSRAGSAIHGSCWRGTRICQRPEDPVSHHLREPENLRSCIRRLFLGVSALRNGSERAIS